ncbi:MAG: LptA/OstA family protein [Trueperaceae bacterium]|nr:LptA/OstA family protein [Trueperaceae bacterium]
MPRGRRPARDRRLGTLWLAAGAFVALAQGLPTVTVERSDRTIVVEQRTTGVEGARTVLANRNCEPGVLTNLFFGPVPGFVTTRFDETELVSQLAIVRVPQPAADDDPAATDDQETIELLGGTATFDRPGCLEALAPEGARPVELRQGRTTITGARFFLDRGTDLATMDGPVTLERRAQGDGPTLEATADALTFDVADERATLTGSVVITSGERVSQADRLELDDAAGVAVLTGAPAVSRRGNDEVRGSTLRYDLETDDVVVIGSVSASFEVDLGDDGSVAEDGGETDAAEGAGGADPIP